MMEFAKYGNAKMVAGGPLWFRLEAMLLTGNPTQLAWARLFNLSTRLPVEGSQVVSDWTAYPRPRRRLLWERLARNLLALAGIHVFPDEFVERHKESARFRLPDEMHEYEIQFGGLRGGTYTCHSAQLVCSAGPRECEGKGAT